MPREWPGGQPSSEQPVGEERINKLIEAGKAIDREDAEEAIWQESALAEFCECDYASYLADLDRMLGDPERDQLDRDHISFWKAAVETAHGAENPWELEFLVNNVLADFEFGKAQGPREQARLVSSKRRLDTKIQNLAAQVGAERAQQLFDQYRRRLQSYWA